MDRGALKEAVRTGTLVPLETLRKETRIDRKSLVRLLDREGIPMYPNPVRRGRVTSRADILGLVAQLRAAGGTECADCGERTGSVTAEFCAQCVTTRRIKGLRGWHIDLNRDPQAHRAFYEARSRKARRTDTRAQRERITGEGAARSAAVENTRRWTRDTAADFLGVPKPTFVAYEKNRQPPSLRIAPIEILPPRLNLGFGQQLFLPHDVKRLGLELYRTYKSADPVELYRRIARFDPQRAETFVTDLQRRLQLWARIRIGTPGRPKAEGVRELLVAAAQQAIYLNEKAGRLGALSFTQLCAEAGRQVWLDQVVSGEYYWLPESWASPRDANEIAKEYGPNLTARVRGLVGPDLKKLLQTAGK